MKNKPFSSHSQPMSGPTAGALPPYVASGADAQALSQRFSCLAPNVLETIMQAGLSFTSVEQMERFAQGLSH